MRRVLDFILGNWPLKLGAIALATVLYGGVVLSENTRTWPGQVPIDVKNAPPGAAVLDVLGPVTSIQYRVPLDAASQVTNDCFSASVDLTHVQPQVGGPPVEVPVDLFAVCGRMQIIDYTPRVVNVRVDPVVTHTLPVTVDHGVVPEALKIGPPQVDPQSVSVTGASSRVSTIRSIVAHVTVDLSGLNVDQEVDLAALDDNGIAVPGVQLSPSRAHVRMNVSRQLASTTLPVIPVFSGEPTAGYEVTGASPSPVSVTVSGEQPAVERLSGANTLPIDLSGRSDSFGVDVPLDLPPEITVDGPSTVHVSVSIAPKPASRTLEVAVEPVGSSPVLVYGLARPSVLVTVAGPAPIVDALAVTDLHATIDVASLGIGATDVPVEVSAPPGITIGAVNPAEVTVTVSEAPPPSLPPSPPPSLAPSPDLSASPPASLPPSP